MGFASPTLKKTKKWGFRNFVRAGSSGTMHDFFLYSGKMKNEKMTGPYVVERLLETLPKMKNFKVFFDNWFAAFPLCLALKKNGYLVTATPRKNRTKHRPLPIEKDLKKKGRGSHEYRTAASSAISITKWYDKKCVQLISSYYGPDSTSKVKRWDSKSKTYIDIDCPTAVQEYNKSMGGINLADMLIALCRTTVKSKRWYLIVLFHCVDIAKINAWLLYRHHCDQQKVPKKLQIPLLKFTSSIALALTKSGTYETPRSVGRPRSSRDDNLQSAKKRKVPNEVPIGDVRYDNIAQWSEFGPTKNKCRH